MKKKPKKKKKEGDRCGQGRTETKPQRPSRGAAPGRAAPTPTPGRTLLFFTPNHELVKNAIRESRHEDEVVPCAKTEMEIQEMLIS